MESEMFLHTTHKSPCIGVVMSYSPTLRLSTPLIRSTLLAYSQNSPASHVVVYYKSYTEKDFLDFRAISFLPNSSIGQLFEVL